MKPKEEVAFNKWYDRQTIVSPTDKDLLFEAFKAGADYQFDNILGIEKMPPEYQYHVKNNSRYIASFRHLHHAQQFARMDSPNNLWVTIVVDSDGNQLNFYKHGEEVE